MGVWAQICFQNGGVTQAGSLMALDDRDLALSILQMFNDGAMDRQKESGQRLFSLAQLPLWDQKAMETEARRSIDGGLRGFVLPDIPERYSGVGAFNEPYWAGFFEMCEATGTPINFHLASAMDPGPMMWRGFDFGQRLAIGAMMMFIGNAATLSNFICSGILDKYPKLKIGLIESGAGWVPFVLEALEHQFDEMMPNRAAKLRPWEYFRRNFWITFWFEKIAPTKLIEDIGDRLMFETDFPHPTSLYPGVQRHLVAALGEHPYAVRKRVLQDNPTELYRLPI
jgi:predicted TIM-barrel fold metal-dependent hydrolase